jgi:hypothetical protein
MGKVYKAHDTEISRDVAVNVLATEPAEPSRAAPAFTDS